ncbi:MAG: hypothetical protein JST80_06255 [Bdellovibrionales bacterium]|nr:hypothetical protein [Bdellovibrionales bacterium]
MHKIKHLRILGLILAFGVTMVHAEEIKGVKLSDSAKVDIKTITKKGESYVSKEIKRATKGLRQKKVAFFWASVYVAQVFTDAKLDFANIDKLRESLITGVPFVVTMTFVRDVGIDKIVDGYSNVFKGNGVKLDEEPFKDFLDAVKKSGDVKDKQVYEFQFINDAAAKFEVKFSTKDKVQYTAKGLTEEQFENFAKMWFGKAVDSGLEQLQEQMLKPDENI